MPVLSTVHCPRLNASPMCIHRVTSQLTLQGGLAVLEQEWGGAKNSDWSVPAGKLAAGRPGFLYALCQQTNLLAHCLLAYYISCTTSNMLACGVVQHHYHPCNSQEKSSAQAQCTVTCCCWRIVPAKQGKQRVLCCIYCPVHTLMRYVCCNCVSVSKCRQCLLCLLGSAQLLKLAAERRS